MITMVSASDFTKGKIPFSGETISTNNFVKYVSGTIMILSAVKIGAFALNKGQNQIGVSQDETQVNLV